MLIAIPALTYSEPNDGPLFALEMVQAFNINQGVTQESRQEIVDTFIAGLDESYKGTFVEYLSVQPSFGDTPIVNNPDAIDSLRDIERIEDTLSDFDPVTGISYISQSIYNLSSVVKVNAMYNILLTCFIGVMLVGFSIIFSNDTHEIVIAPIERMITMVNAVARDPLQPLHNHKKIAESGDYETRLLESTIAKITGLLRVGFGEAGAGIISANLSTEGNSTSSINPLLPGVRI